MGAKYPVDKVSISGFKSIKRLKSFSLTRINVLIGANGVGKSNFISFFKLLNKLVNQQLQNWVSNQGSADRIVTFGIKETNELDVFIEFKLNGYKFTLEAAIDGSFVFKDESLFFDGPYFGPVWEKLGSGHQEAKLKKNLEDSNPGSVADYCYSSIASWKVFHFHDTSDTAGVKRLGPLHDSAYLREDASNLAAYLYRLANESPETYKEIRRTVALVVPFFDDFILEPQELTTEEKQIRLLWKQKNSDYALWPSQLSDGSIRFICLATALLQPDPPSTVIIDEPELGLHPYAITLLGSLIRSASKKMQIIVSTQSVPLINEFSINDLIVVEREEGASVFTRPNEEDFQEWLDNYSIGELWEKNILGGRPK